MAKIGVCKCTLGFVGASCSQKCPANKAGVTCSGHGTCSLSASNRSQCKCQDGWVGHNCGDRVCATVGGIFNKKTKQCTCATGEVCCSRKTQRMAAMYESMMAQEKTRQRLAMRSQELLQFESTAKKAQIEPLLDDDDSVGVNL